MKTVRVEVYTGLNHRGEPFQHVNEYAPGLGVFYDVEGASE